MNKLNKHVFITGMFLLFCSLTIFLTSCDEDVAVNEDTRNIVIDVENRIFNDSTETNDYDQGPGVSSIDFTILLTTDGEENDQTLTMNSGNVDSSYDYTQMTQSVSGELTGINATAYYEDGTQAYYTSIDDSYEQEDYNGWEAFSNVTKFAMDFHGSSSDWTAGYINMDIAPRGGNAVYFIDDSGVTDNMLTDWDGADLTSGEIAIQPVLNENPTDLTFDIYCLVVDSDIKSEWDPDLNDEAEYSYYPWEDVWSYAEVAETGKTIGYEGDVYTLTKYNASEMNFIEPEGDGCGFNSFMIDATSLDEDAVGKYLLVALIMKYGGLEIPTYTDVIEIE